MDSEGALRVGLQVDGGRVTRVRITSSRPNIARDLLSGRSCAEATAMVRRLYSICAASQSAASELACAAAAGEAVDERMLERARRAVSSEVLRETAWRTLLEWPKALGERPAEQAIAAARSLLASPVSGSNEAIALALFDSPAEQWLALHTLPALQHWADQGHTATARFLRHVFDVDAGTRRRHRGQPVPLLAIPAQSSAIAELGDAADDDPGSALRPLWHGAPVETGALARQQTDVLLQALMLHGHSRVPARFVARLRELALLLAGRGQASLGAVTLADGSGLSWVENARGLLLHRLRLEQGRTARYCIVAPTDWNFHPAGVLPAALRDSPAHDLDALHRHARVLVDSLDPCVDCQVEFEDA